MATLIEYRQQLAERDLAMAWPQWRIIRLLGTGAFGEVYEIHREEYGRVSKCALKVIRKENAAALPGDAYHSISHGNASDEFITTVLKEIDIMEKLKGASNIVVIDDYTVVRNPDSSAVLIRMELLTNLGEFMTTRQVLVNDILKIGIDICNALEHCEQQNIIHRDVKESNIFYSDQGDFKLGDFGISKQLNNYLLNSGTMTAAGTVSKMAPEVYKGQHYDNTVDIYSLGIVLYSLLNYGRSPFYPPYPEPVTAEAAYSADMRRVQGLAIPPLAGVDKKLNSIILKACSPKPSSRYGTAEEFKNALQAYYAEINGLEWNGPRQALSPNSKYVIAAAIIAAVVIITGSVSAWHIGRVISSILNGAGAEVSVSEQANSGFSPDGQGKQQGIVINLLSHFLIGDHGSGNHSDDSHDKAEDYTRVGDVTLQDENGKKLVTVREPDWSTYSWISDEQDSVHFSGADHRIRVYYYESSYSSAATRVKSDRESDLSSRYMEVESVTETTGAYINGLEVYWYKIKYRDKDKHGTLGSYVEKYAAFVPVYIGYLDIEMITSSEERYIEMDYDDLVDGLALCTLLE